MKKVTKINEVKQQMTDRTFIQSYEREVIQWQMLCLFLQESR